MNVEEKFTLIEKYLAEELQGEALKKFEAQLQTDEQLNEELTLHRQLADTLKGEKVHELRNVLKDVDKNWEDSSKKDSAKIVNFNFKRVLAIAATIALFVISYQWFSNQELSSEEIYATHFEPYPMLLNQRSIDETTTDSEIYNNAISFYAKGENADALAAFDKLLDSQPDNITFQFYKANIHLSSMDATSAIPIFQKILTSENPNFIEQTRWYLALAHLQNDDKENAKVLLQEIKEGQFKFGKAKSILKNY